MNIAVSTWLKNDYHHRLHTGIDERPIDRYHRSCTQANIKRLTKAELDEIFLIRHERVMNNDVTISFKNNFYEVPAAYIRQRIEIRPTVEDERELYLYDNEVRVVKIKFVDKKQNAKTFKPDCSQTNISFSKGKVTK